MLGGVLRPDNSTRAATVSAANAPKRSAVRLRIILDGQQPDGTAALRWHRTILVKPGCRATVPLPRTRSRFLADRCAEPESRDSGLVFGQ